MIKTSSQLIMDGFLSVFEKRAFGVFDALDAAANLKTVDDLTNKSIRSEIENAVNKPKKRKKSPRIRMSIDKDLLATLTPEQRKELFFAVRGIKAN